MKRSKIIELAQELLVQGSIDPFWTTAKWDIMFNEAVDMVHEQLIDGDTGFFLTRNAQLVKDENDHYPLPENMHHIRYLEDSTGEIQSAMLEDEGTMTGYVIVDNHLELVDWRGSLPETLTCHYVRNPKEMTPWNGTEDPDEPEFIPDPPLDTARGARVIARIMQLIAQGEDGTLGPANVAHASGIINRFVDHLEARSEIY